jgi:hypothetical protein
MVSKERHGLTAIDDQLLRFVEEPFKADRADQHDWSPFVPRPRARWHPPVLRPRAASLPGS